MRLPQLRWGAVEHDLPPSLTRSRADIDDAIGGHHELRVMLHHDQGVACVSQAVHDFDHAMNVAGMQANGRLVQHKQRVDQ